MYACMYKQNKVKYVLTYTHTYIHTYVHCTYVRMYWLDYRTLHTHVHMCNAGPCTNQTQAHYKFNRVGWWEGTEEGNPVLKIVTGTPISCGAIIPVLRGLQLHGEVSTHTLGYKSETTAVFFTSLVVQGCVG